MVQENVVVEIDGTSDDPRRDMLMAALVVVVQSAKSGVHDTGQELFLELGAVLESALLRLGSAVRQELRSHQR